MSDGHRSGRSTGRVSCKSTELKRCSVIEMILQKWPNESNCHFGYGLGWAEGTMCSVEVEITR